MPLTLKLMDLNESRALCVGRGSSKGFFNFDLLESRGCASMDKCSLYLGSKESVGHILPNCAHSKVGVTFLE